MFSVRSASEGCHLCSWYRGVKQPGREADHAPLSNAEIKNDEAILPPPYMFMAWCLRNGAPEFAYICMCVCVLTRGFYFNRKKSRDALAACRNEKILEPSL